MKRLKPIITILLVLTMSLVLIFCASCAEVIPNTGSTPGTGDSTEPGDSIEPGDSTEPGDSIEPGDSTGGSDSGNLPVEPQSAISLVSPENEAEVVLANDEVWEYYNSYTTASSEKYKNKGDQFAGKSVTLEWGTEKTVTGKYTVYIADNPDFLSPVKVVTEETSLTLSTLFTGEEYFWRVEAEIDGKKESSDVGSFTTAVSPRTVVIEGVSNTRDFGGNPTADGKVTAQGLVYRAASLDSVTFIGKKQAQAFGIKTDLDLRRSGEGTAGKGSPLGDSINYVNISAAYYTNVDASDTFGIDDEDNFETVAREIKMFANPANYPIVFHCSVGRDRTGTLAFLLNALVGVEYQDIARDYELSFFSAAGCNDAATTGPTYMVGRLKYAYDYIMAYTKTNKEKTLAEHTESYLLDIGVTAAEIATIRSILLGEYEGEIVKPYLGIAFDNGNESLEMIDYPQNSDMPDTTLPTVAQLNAGFTYDWVNTYTPVTNGELMPVAEIADEAVKTALLGKPDAFGSNVMHLFSTGEHTIGAITVTNNPDYFKVGYEYTIEFDYYAKTLATNYFIVMDATSGNHTVANGFLKKGEVGKAKLSFIVDENKPYAFTIYSGGDALDMYIGNLKFTYTEAPEQRTDYHALTRAELTSESGYTFKLGENDIPNISANAEFVKLDDISDVALKTALNESGAYTNGWVLKMKGTSVSVINSLNGLLTVGNKFTVSFDAYVVSGGNNLLLLAWNGKQVGNHAEFTRTAMDNGLTHFTAEMTVAETVNTMVLFGNGNYEIYLANLTVREISATVEEGGDNGDNGGNGGTASVGYHTLTKGEATAASGYTFDMSEGNFLEFAIAEYVTLDSLSSSVKSALEGTGNFENGYAMRLKYNSAASLTVMDFLTQFASAGTKITVEFDAYVVSGQGNLRILQLIDGKQNGSSCKYTVTENGDGSMHYTCTFSVYDTGIENLGWYGAGDYEMYLSSFTVKVEEA